MNRLTKWIMYAVYLFSSTWMIEHICHICDIANRPSVLFTYLYVHAEKLYTNVGKLIAIISSFYELIQFDELKKSFTAIFKPLVRFVVAPSYIIYGYVSECNLYEHPYLIGFGTLTLICVICYLCERYFNTISRLYNRYFYPTMVPMVTAVTAVVDDLLVDQNKSSDNTVCLGNTSSSLCSSNTVCLSTTSSGTASCAATISKPVTRSSKKN